MDINDRIFEIKMCIWLYIDIVYDHVCEHIRQWFANYGFVYTKRNKVGK